MLLRFTRTWLPALIVAAGVIAMVAGGFSDTALEGGAGVIGAGLSVWLLNWLHRLGVSGDDERSAEDEARAYFDKFGHWPDEAPRRERGADPHARPGARGPG
ncbi:hypothetical protein [Conexibacter sp. SYSU D00693]|uniref:hypothetical protein n=1 Tax=Conexibacter sp. SYSU D00693 TaxID=2812560 RepID=UPI00196A575A|nr:hypothetical protein [Conexibacter sp. SYSU D00693]